MSIFRGVGRHLRYQTPCGGGEVVIGRRHPLPLSPAAPLALHAGPRHKFSSETGGKVGGGPIREIAELPASSEDARD